MWNIYNKNSISRKTKLSNYNTVIKPEALYALGTFSISGRLLIKVTEKQVNKIIRKVFSHIYIEEI